MPLPLGPFPYILTDGTLADANQVMANFNLLLNGVNGLAPLGVSTPGQTSNVRANLATAGTSVTVTADIVNVATALNGTSYTLVTYNQVFNGATTGPGGMDTGTLPAGGFVALYAIYNPNAPQVSILGTNANVSAPTIYGGANMPAGYTASALLGVWRTNATPALVAGVVRGKTFAFALTYALNNSTVNQASFVSLSCASIVPPNAISIGGLGVIACNASQGATNVLITIASDAGGSGSTAAGVFTPAAGAGPQYQFGYSNLLLGTPQALYYQTGGIGANISLYIGITQYSWP